MADFAPFALAVHQQFNKLAKQGELFVVPVDKDLLWATYLASFPAGTNPIFRTNTEHDCSCCRNFVKNIGNVVAFNQAGELLTVWDALDGLPDTYSKVSLKMAEFIATTHAQAGINGVFRSAEPSYGAEHTKELHEGGKVTRWNHFHTGAMTPYFYKGKDAAEARGKYATNQQTLLRALTELTPEAVDQVLSLIDAKALYRGEEKRALVAHFQSVQTKYRAIESMAKRNIFTWLNAGDKAAYFRNDVIGTLCVDLSEGVDLEQAVKIYESKVAPTNYKRTTALVTPKMVEEAAKTIDQLGFTPSLKRRLARLTDVSVNNVLWVDGGARNLMKGNALTDILGTLPTKTAAKVTKNAVDIDMYGFMTTVLPTATGIDLLVQNQHTGNFMALTTAEDQLAPNMFAWDNNFAWAYDGNVTDSIRERVKKAGGNVDAPLRFSLSWFNADDLDLHVVPPSNNEIYFGSKQGILDVDTNGGGPQNHVDPVENASFTASKIFDGLYTVFVRQYRKIGASNGGFDFEIFTNGAPRFFSYKNTLRQNEKVVVGTFTVKRGVITEWKLNPALTEGSASVNKWGVTTETFVPVQTVMYSPNHWDGLALGNRHWFFFLQGCKVDAPVRGMFNEFLHPDLIQHRKVLELVGDKTKCPVTDDHLAGLGFSSTKPATITLRVRDSNSVRTYNVTI